MSVAAAVRFRWLWVVAAGFVVGALVFAACGEDRGLSSSDRHAYTEAAEAFVAANASFQTAQIAPDQGESTTAALAVMRVAVDDMKKAHRQMGRVERRLDGEPAIVVAKSTASAAEVIAASEAFIAAVEANDPVAWADAYDANSEAIEQFNRATAEWNAL